MCIRDRGVAGTVGAAGEVPERLAGAGARGPTPRRDGRRPLMTRLTAAVVICAYTAQRMTDIEAAVASVSYTHLDVYKRQGSR